MIDKLNEYLSIVLITLSSGGQITLGQALSAVGFVLFALLMGRYLSRLLSSQLKRGQVDPNASQTIIRLFYWIFFILVFITAMGMLDIPITHLAFISGAVAIGVGFGAQNIINNLISSWILMSEKPVRIGDFIEIDQHMGIVEAIGNRSTRIRRIDGVHVMVPNSQMLERVVVNWTLIDRRFRSSVRVGVAYGSDVRKASKLMGEAAKVVEKVLNDPPAVVVFEDFGDSSLVFDLFFWCDVSGGGELRVIRSSLRFEIDRLFRENDIVISFPQRDVHLDAMQPLEVRVTSDQRPDPSSAGQPSSGNPS